MKWGVGGKVVEAEASSGEVGPAPVTVMTSLGAAVPVKVKL